MFNLELLIVFKYDFSEDSRVPPKPQTAEKDMTAFGDEVASNNVGFLDQSLLSNHSIYFLHCFPQNPWLIDHFCQCPLNCI
ncbi:unnamed protein product, partial [Vitis vinifera]